MSATIWNRRISYSTSESSMNQKVTHMILHIFFKVGERSVRITIDHGLEIFSQTIAARIQVRGSRKSNCRKLLAGNSIVTEMVAST